MGKFARTHRDLDVYQKAFQTATHIFEVSKSFPRERSFVSKLSDAESEAAETQVWIEFAVQYGYIQRDEGLVLYQSYDDILGKLVSMINDSSSWVLSGRYQARNGASE